MACESVDTRTEFDFVVGLSTRDPGQCRGPLLRLGLSRYRPFALDRMLGSAAATALLWSGFDPDWGFSLCAGHWLDLACVCWMRGQACSRVEWQQEGHLLLEDLCTAAGWDVKEIVNMFAWQRPRLT